MLFYNNPELSPNGSMTSASGSLDSRPQSTSPTFSSTFTSLAKLRQESCRGFNIEDDHEFCPAIIPHEYSNIIPQHVTPIRNTYRIPVTTPPMDDGDEPTFTLSSRKALDIINPITGMPLNRS